MTKFIEIVEVSLRDGIQNEKTLLRTEDKAQMIEQAIDAGIRRLEVTSFVNPKKVPQMADGAELLAMLPQRDDVTYIGLVLNERGFDRAIDAKVDEVNFVIVATDTFSMRNQGASTSDTLKIWDTIASRAKGQIRAGITIGASFGCPFEGEVSVDKLLNIVEEAAKNDPIEIALADTIGVAVPSQVTMRINAVRERFPEFPIRCHFHNTRNTGFANAWAAVEAGVTTLDSSFAGTGGCPFAPRATGNIATEDLIYMLDRSGVETGVDFDKTVSAAQRLEELLGKTLPGQLMKAGGFPAMSA